MRIPISEIKVSPGRREAAPADVRELADSIAEIGLLNPVTVSQSRTLIAGLHRLEAAALLAAGEIQSVEEYAPPARAGPVPQPAPALNPDTLAAEASQFAQVLRRIAERCRPEAFAQLTPPQLSILRRQMGSAREAIEKFEKLLEMSME